MYLGCGGRVARDGEAVVKLTAPVQCPAPRSVPERQAACRVVGPVAGVPGAHVTAAEICRNARCGSDVKCYVRGEGGNTVSFPPEPLCVCPGSLTKQEAPAMGLVPGPLLSPERGQRGPAAPSTWPCLELPPSLSLEAGSASSSLVSGCPWLLCCLPVNWSRPCWSTPRLG